MTLSDAVIPVEIPLPLLGAILIGTLAIVLLCFNLFLMLRQQKFLHDLFLTLRGLEQRNREAQRDLFVILKNNLGLPDRSSEVRRDTTVAEKEQVLRHGTDPVAEQGEPLSLDEVQLLVTLSGSESPNSKSLSDIRENVKGFDNLDNNLRALREKGFIFYSDFSDVVVILPKGHRYLGRLRP